jgi:hypothetical protein
VAAVGCGGGGGGGNNTAGRTGGGGMAGHIEGAGATGTDGGTCSFTPCGGDIVGTWRLSSICALGPASDCPPSGGVTVDRSKSEATFTFASDGTVVYAYSGTLTETLLYPDTCLAGIDAGTARACSDFQSEVQSSIQRDDGGAPLAGLTSFTCSVNASSICMCDEVFTSAPQTENGTYTTSGDQVTITLAAADGGAVDGGTNPPSEYCVSGNTLTLHTINSTGESVATLTK